MIVSGQSLLTSPQICYPNAKPELIFIKIIVSLVTQRENAL